MANEKDYQQLLDQIAAFRAQAAKKLGPSLAANPLLAELVSDKIDDLEQAYLNAEHAKTPPADGGLSDLVGLGPTAPTDLSNAYMSPDVQPYDETVASERIIAMGDLYYVCQHEMLGVFRALRKLEQLWAAGAVRLSNGDGAQRLYRFSRRAALRFTQRERLGAYCRAFGYCSAPPPAGSKPNGQFHPLFTHFAREVALFWRDKRISDVIRERANDPTFGSVSTVRRAGLDLRNNLKFASYGHLLSLRVEVLQLLDEAFRIFGAADVQNLFGASGPWDVIEEILTRYFNEGVTTSPRQRMAVAGQKILQWLAQPFILRTGRTQFESLLVDIAEYSEEWLTSAESLGITRPRSKDRLAQWGPRAINAEERTA